MALSIAFPRAYHAPNIFHGSSNDILSENALAGQAPKYVLNPPSDAFTDKIQEYTEQFRGRFQVVEGGVWGLCWSLIAYDLCRHLGAYISARGLDPAQNENQKKLYDEAKKTFVSAISLSGVTASIATWAGRARIIALGKYALFLQKFSCASYAITAAFGIEKSVQTIMQEISDLDKEDENKRIKYDQHYRLALIDLASHVSTLAWAILGITELCIGVAFSPALMTSIFVLSCALAVVSLCYSIYIDYNAEPPPPAEAAS